MMKVSEILDKAADLIEPVGRWAQGDMARDRKGRPVSPLSPKASCFCIAGALDRVAGGAFVPARVDAGFALMSHLDDRPYTDFNDAPGRRQADVVTFVREAARKEREAGR